MLEYQNGSVNHMSGGASVVFDPERCCRSESERERERESRAAIPEKSVCLNR